MKTIREILKDPAPGLPAIAAPGRSSLTYGDLNTLLEQTRSALDGFGIVRGDRVSIVLPNGPQMATAFLAVGSCTSAAPLNPAYTKDEFSFYLEDLGARAVIVEKDSPSPVVIAAQELGIQVLNIDWTSADLAGFFRFTGTGAKGGDTNSRWPDSQDEALVLHTSGTTSRPKIVPLSQGNVSISAGNVSATLELTSADLCMNIMPLFHIHGLIAAVLSSLHAGACIYCTPGFNALKVFGWFEDAKPSWYTAVPTMHQAILARAGRNGDVVAAMKLRLVRSSSSSLPPQVMAELEQVFSCPVVEAYGMTEAAHQMASNPIRPGGQKPGAVGLAAGPKLAIFADGAVTNAAGVLGEIVICGDNVTSGYQSNDTANAEAFFKPVDSEEIWFRTGDQGRLDDEGYLYITGRLKEIINRGGEKISPREVDEILMNHPAVAQAVTFALPHKQLGEDVAVALVLNEGMTVKTSEIREFAGLRLAAFKVPRKVLFVDEIPKGATGKLQRIGLHEVLGLGGDE